jgi:PAS domain S-box-containing protein
MRQDGQNIHASTEPLIKKSAIYQSPLRLLFIITFSVFISEAFIMFFLSFFPNVSTKQWIFIDATLLIVILSPVLYFFAFRPLIMHIAERKRAEETTKRAYVELDQIFQTAADGMRLIDKNYTIVKMNETFAVLSGIGMDEAVGKKCYEVFPGSQCRTQQCSLYRVLSGEDRIEFEAVKERRDGIWVPCIVTATPFQSPTGELLGIVEDFKDITERKRSEKVLMESEEKYRTIFETTGTAMIIIEEDSLVSLANAEFEKLSGYTKEELERKKSWLTFFIPSELERLSMCQQTRTVDPDRLPRSCEFKFTDEYNRVKDILLTIALIPGTQKTVASILDITEWKRADEALKKSEEEKEIILDAMSERLSYRDRDMKIVWANRAFVDNTGLTPEKVTGRYCYEILNKRSDPCPECLFHVKVLETGKLREMEIPTPDGKIWFVRGYPVRDLEGNINGIVEISTDITERKRAECEVQSLKQQIEFILGAAKTGLDIIDSEFNIRYIDPEWEKIYGDPAGRKCYEYFMGRDKICPGCGIQKAMETKTITVTEEVLVKEGNRPIQVTTIPFQNEEGEWLVAEVNVDITERKKLEEQLLQAQKMEAVGQLAGGIAHDFNNLLTAIIGYGNLLQMDMSKNDPLRADVDQILTAAQRAASLTRALLAFSRKQIINPMPINLDQIIGALEKLLSRIIGEDIELSTLLTDEDLTVMADGTQMEQVLMNLATNARDAMPDGGILTIRTELVKFDYEYIKAHGYGMPGSYALISVEDTGQGMDVETRERIFEPFYTTKEVGKGTGLGLAMVYGIIKQHDGYINVYSEPGKGTTFKIYLPLIRSKVEEEKPADLSAVERGTETVLVAEDDVQVRDLTKRVLEGSGYQVMEAENGEEAMRVFNENKDKIQLLILDVIMPKKNGKEVYDEIKKTKPDIKAIFASGYNAEVIHKKGILEKGFSFITKPSSPQELLKKVREVLDNRGPLYAKKTSPVAKEGRNLP